MLFTNLTRAAEIGANSYLLQLDGHTIVVDSGMHPKEEGWKATPDFTPITPGTVDHILVTHAHQDHIGSLPVLTRQETQARVFMTEPTYRIADTMLHNSVNVMQRQKEAANIECYPLFTHRGVTLSANSWHRVATNTRIGVDGERDSRDEATTFEFYQAGHILGAAGVLIRHQGKSLFFTGDVNFEDQTLTRGAEFPESGVDVLVMEATRGDSPTPAGFSRQAEEQRLMETILAAFEAGSCVTIPVFALGKTQELLAMFWKWRLEKNFPDCPVYIGGLSSKITTIYDQLAQASHRAFPNLNLLEDVSPYVVGGPDIQALSPHKGSIYALSSGMMTEHTLSNVFARRILEHPDMHLCFVGYSDPDSPAGKIRAAKPGDQVQLDAALPAQQLRCQVHEFNFSAHASRESLRDYAIRLKPKQILLVHGDVPALEWMRSEISAALPGCDVRIPPPGQTIDLLA